MLVENSILMKHLYPSNKRWNEEQFLALSCLLAILNKEKNENSIGAEYLKIIQTVAIKTLYSIPNENVDQSYFNKVLIFLIQPEKLNIC